MRRTEATIHSIRGIQRPLIVTPNPSCVPTPFEVKGVVYTKRWVVELMLDLAGYRSEYNLVDTLAIEPAAGDGAFLGPMIERLIDSCQRLERPFSDCHKSLLAYELDDDSAQRARALAVDVLEARGVTRALAESLAGGWIRNADYLFDGGNAAADFVIGNPPYVRLEEIPEETVALYRHAYPTMRGRADLYIGFFEAALRQLRDGGVCAFICADRWMRNQYGADLRDMVTEGFAVETVIEMHNADAFREEVDAYPAITIIRHSRQASVVLATAGPQVEKISPRALSTKLLSADRSNQSSLDGLRTAVVDTWFKGGDPWPYRSPEQLALLRRLEEHFPVLETYARVGIGVATGNDGVFISKDADLVESSRLLKLALVSDICDGALKWSGHYLVDPWDNDGLVDLDRYPRLRSYFLKHEVALRKRHTAAKNIRGWYKTIDRVTHALTTKPKLYIADIKNVLNPVLDSGETYPHHNVYFIHSDVWDLEVLGGLLMSALGQFFVESYGVRMRGGYLRFQAQYLRRICVPAPGTLSKAQLHELKTAFRKRDRERATRAALQAYGIDAHTLETALGH